MLIAIDHGNKQIKTVHCPPFVSGLTQSATEPYGKDILKYKDLYYTLSDQRIPYHKDKSEDDRFFILTLFAVAEEIETQGRYEKGLINIQLAIGVPPAYYGSQGKALVNYFKDRPVVQFVYGQKRYAIYIEDVRCYPQAYAAAATLLQSLVESPRALILDIGGHTADYIVMKNGKPNFNSLQSCSSLENGVDVFYNRTRAILNAEKDILLEESEIDAILKGNATAYPAEAVQIVRQQAQEFVNDLFSTLRERQIELRSSKVVFVGGGSILLRRQIEESGKIGTPMFVNDINANARGYEFLYKLESTGR